MPPGRPPKPIAQRRREGNAGKRALPQEIALRDAADAPDLPAGLEPPADLAGAGLELWKEIVPTLAEAGIIHPVDRPNIQMLCVHWNEAELARAVLRTEGRYALGSMGQIVEHPALGVMRAAHAAYLKIAQEYGLTAAARARIAATISIANTGGGMSELERIRTSAPEAL